MIKGIKFSNWATKYVPTNQTHIDWRKVRGIMRALARDETINPIIISDGCQLTGTHRNAANNLLDMMDSAGFDVTNNRVEIVGLADAIDNNQLDHETIGYIYQSIEDGSCYEFLNDIFDKN